MSDLTLPAVIPARQRFAPAITAAATILVAAALLVLTLDSDGKKLAQTQTIGLTLATLVAALGLNLLSGYSGLISLGQGGFFAIGAYGTASLKVDAGLPYLPAIAISLALCAIAGTGIALAAARLHGPQLAMVTLVFAVVIHRLLVELPRFGRLAGYPNRADHESALVPPPQVGGTTFDPPLFAGVTPMAMILIIGLTVVAFLAYVNLANSPWGRSLRAIQTSEIMASHVGVDVNGRKVSASVLASLFGGVAGVMYLFLYGHLQPESFTLFLGVNLLVAVILGGSGSLLGPLVGAVAVAMLSDSSLLHEAVDVQQRFISETWFLSGEGLVALIMLVVLLVLPRGLWGSVSHLMAQRKRARTTSESALAEPAHMTLPIRTDQAGSVLSVVDYAKRFGGNQAVSEMNLEVNAGEVHALIGPNGAGKSTFANLVSGVYRSDTGDAVLKGQSIHGRRAHEIARLGVGRTFQTPLIDLERSCVENVLLGAPSSGSVAWWQCALRLPSVISRERDEQRLAAELLTTVGLFDQRDTPAGDLSYGQQRSLEIARVLAGAPDLVIMDEPAAGLNPAERSRLADLIGLIRDSGVAVVMVEHHMDLVRLVADRVTCMAEGSVLASGSIDTVLTDAQVIESYLGQPADTQKSELANVPD